MAMLAEPRRKQKIINLRAKNNAWSNDSTKFGQRMLEKMGWTSGKGLGAHENGITEHVVARYKNDDKGLGFEDKNDQWTKHEDDFNALLANLSNASDNNENLHSGVSLEDKSKKSKARIHYHKFTRGKDISRYSEKDLANIFGKKSFKNKPAVEESLKEDTQTTEQVFTEKGSMEDYFQIKLAAIKSKNKTASNIKESDCDDLDYAFCGFSQNACDTNDSSTAFEYSTDKNIESLEYSILEPICDTKSKKKNKKLKNSDHVNTTIDINISLNSTQDQENLQENNDCHTEVQMKKKKKSKDKIDRCAVSETKNYYDNNCILGNVVIDEKKSSSKKIKKCKNKGTNMNECVSENHSINDSIICDNVDVVQLNKNKKSKNKKDESYLFTEDILEETTGVPKKKKKKKNKD